MSYVYFIQCGEAGPVKIGVALRPHKRLDQLQNSNPEQLHLRAFIHGGYPEERVLHERFAAGRLRGEWFRADVPGLADVIARAANGNARRSRVPDDES